MRFTTVSLLLILLASAGGGGFATISAQQGQPYKSEEFRTGPSAQLTVRSVEGNIQVRATDSDIVRVDLFVKKGLSFFSAGSELDDVRIVIYQRHNTVVATVESKRSGAWQSSGTQYHFVVTVPRNTSTNLSTARGNIEVMGLNGMQDLRVAGGNIRVERSVGEVRASVVGGNVTGIRHDGVFFARTSGGSVDLSEIHGETRARAVGGNLNLDGMRGTVIGAATAGNIIADIRQMAVGLDLDATGGNLSVTIPGMVGSTLNVNGSQVRVNRPRNFEGDITSMQMKGTLNGGGIPVKLRSSGGVVDLTIRQDRP